MNDFLLVLFYQAIVAVNTAVIISGIIWLAKRKEKKDGRKPNPDFTPPPEKKPEVELRSALIRTVNGEKIAQRWYAPDEQIPRYAILQGEPYKFFAEMDKDGGKLVEFVRIKPPTTGTNVIKPKPHGYHLTMTTYDAKDYGETHTFNGEEYERTMVAQSADGSVVSMNYIRKHPQPKPCEMPKPPTTGSAAIKPKCGISAEEAAKLVSKLAEASACLGGNSELDELRERVKDLADRLDRAEKKPVTLERMKEAGFETEKVRVFDPAEKRWTYREVVKNSKCSDCKHWKKETCSSVGKCEVLDRPTKWYERGCQLFDKWEPPIQTTNICKNCKHYLTTDEDATTGLCGMKDEITFPYSRHACFEKREGE